MTALNFRIVQHAQPSTSGQTTEERLSERIAYQERELSRLRQAALRDPVTGGANMRCLAMAYDWVEDGDPVSMLFIDVDGFRKVNDAVGRDCGDAVLSAIQPRSNAAFAGTTWLPEKGRSIRRLLPLAIEQDAYAVGERLRQAVERMVFQSTQGRFRPRCAGVQPEGEPLNDLLSRADQAARGGARSGGNVVVAS